jgi:hypothetical protein
MIKWRRMLWVLIGKSEGKRFLKDLGIDGRIILKLILKKWYGRAWPGFCCLRIGVIGELL